MSLRPYLFPREVYSSMVRLYLVAPEVFTESCFFAKGCE